jgi:hypothetical protein
MKQLAVSNNTSGASIYDLGNIIQSDSMGTLNNVLKSIEVKQKQEGQAQMQHNEKMKQMELEAIEKEKQMERDFKAQEAEKDRRKDLLVAEIKSAGYGAMQDVNQNQQSDYMDALQAVQKTEQYRDAMSLQREKETNRNAQFQQKTSIEREKIQAQKEIADKQLQVAEVNKNKYDIPTEKPKESKKK